MTGLLQNLEQAIAIVLLIKIAARILGIASWPDRPAPVPVPAIGLFALVAIPTAAQAIWPSVFGALRRDPHLITTHHEYWRLLTSMLVQDGGVAGAIFNLVTLAIVATLAAWFWGGPRTIGFFVVLGFVFDLMGVAYDQAGAGSSGATYGLVATIAGFALVRGSGRLRLGCAAALAFGGLIWAVGNIHGMAVVADGTLGAAYALAGAHPRRCYAASSTYPAAEQVSQ
ncbi:MAG: rhomboid family intramembrane serine protease [Solirubrobacteraceae bacterium]